MPSLRCNYPATCEIFSLVSTGERVCVRVVDMCIAPLMFCRVNWILSCRTVHLEYVNDTNDWHAYISTAVGLWYRTAWWDKKMRQEEGRGFYSMIWTNCYGIWLAVEDRNCQPILFRFGRTCGAPVHTSKKRCVVEDLMYQFSTESHSQENKGNSSDWDEHQCKHLIRICLRPLLCLIIDPKIEMHDWLLCVWYLQVK